MNCDECSGGELVPTRFTYARRAPDGSTLTMEVEGFACPACDHQLILGRDAERISRQWHVIARRATSAAAAHS